MVARHLRQASPHAQRGGCGPPTATVGDGWHAAPPPPPLKPPHALPANYPPNYRPENARSAAVLERLGFAREGFAKGYLYIDGAWRDHVLTALVRPEPSVVPRGDGPARSVAAQQPDLGTRG